MKAMQFDLLETLNMLALLPSLFAVVLLLILNRKPSQIYVPIAFFMTLACSFLIGISEPLRLDAPMLMVLLVWLESMQPAMCFLLVIQLWRNRSPEGVYWLILALPVIGGASLVLASMQLDEACVMQRYCLPASAFPTLYHLFASSLMFLLLMAHLSHTPIASAQKQRYQSHRYWLIIALVASFLTLLVFDLLMLAGSISAFQNGIIHVVMRLVFLYLVMTSLFRVFDPMSQEGDSAAARPVDPEVVAKIEQAMQVDQLYREMGFSREKCAERLELQEHVLSRTINQAFGKNFNEYVNSYRIEEAKERLAKESTSITAIAFEVGFSSIASFNRVFKTMVKCSPTEYRASAEEAANAVKN